MPKRRCDCILPNANCFFRPSKDPLLNPQLLKPTQKATMRLRTSLDSVTNMFFSTFLAVNFSRFFLWSKGRSRTPVLQGSTNTFTVARATINQNFDHNVSASPICKYYGQTTVEGRSCHKSSTLSLLHKITTLPLQYTISSTPAPTKSRQPGSPPTSVDNSSSKKTGTRHGPTPCSSARVFTRGLYQLFDVFQIPFHGCFG